MFMHWSEWTSALWVVEISIKLAWAGREYGPACRTLGPARPILFNKIFSPAQPAGGPAQPVQGSNRELPVHMYQCLIVLTVGDCSVVRKTRRWRCRQRSDTDYCSKWTNSSVETKSWGQSSVMLLNRLTLNHSLLSVSELSGAVEQVDIEPLSS